MAGWILTVLDFLSWSTHSCHVDEGCKTGPLEPRRRDRPASQGTMEICVMSNRPSYLHSPYLFLLIGHID